MDNSTAQLELSVCSEQDNDSELNSTDLHTSGNSNTSNDYEDNGGNENVVDGELDVVDEDNEEEQGEEEEEEEEEGEEGQEENGEEEHEGEEPEQGDVPENDGDHDHEEEGGEEEGDEEQEEEAEEENEDAEEEVEDEADDGRPDVKEYVPKEQTPSNVSLSSKLTISSGGSSTRETSQPLDSSTNGAHESTANGAAAEIVNETVHSSERRDLQTSVSNPSAKCEPASLAVGAKPEQLMTPKAAQFGDCWKSNSIGAELDVFGDGSLRLRTLRSGDERDSRPQNGERARFDYRIALADAATRGGATLVERRGVVAAIGDGDVLFGIETMLRFIERGALVRANVVSKFGFGPSGLPPTVPPNADLLVEIELHAVDPPVDWQHAPDSSKRAFIEAKRSRANFYKSLGQHSAAEVCSSRANEVEKLLEVPLTPVRAPTDTIAVPVPTLPPSDSTADFTADDSGTAESECNACATVDAGAEKLVVPVAVAATDTAAETTTVRASTRLEAAQHVTARSQPDEHREMKSGNNYLLLGGGVVVLAVVLAILLRRR